MQAILIALTLIAAAPVFAQPALPLSEGFETDRDALAAYGWLLPPNASLSEDAFSGDQSLRVEVTETTSKYAALFIPIESGNFYRATVKMRCEDVERNPENRQHRGAAIFLQWADHEKGHVSGGSFPDGLFGTQDWTTREVSWTRKIPENVGYLHLLLGIEGTGVAWFDDLRVERIDPGWPGPEIVAPADGSTVETQRPELQWRELVPGGLSYRVELSSDPQFTEPQTASPGALSWRPDRWLEAGTWYWRIQPRSGADGVMPPARTHSFVVAEDAERWPVEVRPTWEWTDAKRPTLTAQISPSLPDAAVAATIDGRPADAAVENGQIAIAPRADLERGAHGVRIEVRAGEHSATTDAVFANRVPATRVSFRDDRIMLIDGEPFFPLGAYRDPSDRLDTFTGLHEAGFNLTHSYYFENGDPKSVEEAREYLQAAEEAGAHVFLGLSRDRVKARDYAWSERFVGELMDEPALLTWYLLDEPGPQGVSVDVMEQLHESVERTDPFHPTSIVICRPNLFDDYAGAMDICWADVYPLPGGSVLALENRLEAAREQIGPDMPLWAVVQGHDIRYWNGYDAAVAELGPVSIPTPTQTRNMAWLSLANGADGIVWYWGPSSHYKMREDATTVWQGIVDTVQELRGLNAWLVARRSDADEIATPEPFRTWSRSADGVRKLAVLSVSEETATLDLDLSQFGVEQITGPDGAAVRLEGGNLHAEFGPLEVRLYEWPE